MLQANVVIQVDERNCISKGDEESHNVFSVIFTGRMRKNVPHYLQIFMVQLNLVITKSHQHNSFTISDIRLSACLLHADIGNGH